MRETHQPTGTVPLASYTESTLRLLRILPLAVLLLLFLLLLLVLLFLLLFVYYYYYYYLTILVDPL